MVDEQSRHIAWGHSLVFAELLELAAPVSHEAALAKTDPDVPGEILGGRQCRGH